MEVNNIVGLFAREDIMEDLLCRVAGIFFEFEKIPQLVSDVKDQRLRDLLVATFDATRIAEAKKYMCGMLRMVFTEEDLRTIIEFSETPEGLKFLRREFGPGGPIEFFKNLTPTTESALLIFVEKPCYKKMVQAFSTMQHELVEFCCALVAQQKLLEETGASS